MGVRPRTRLVIQRKLKRCPKCGALVRRRTRCKSCGRKQTPA